MAYTYPISKYQPIWNQLKAEGKVSAVVPPILHKRIKKAVIKLKHQDLEFKFMLDEKYKYAIMYSKVTGNTITWELKYFSTFQLGSL